MSQRRTTASATTTSTAGGRSSDIKAELVPLEDPSLTLDGAAATELETNKKTSSLSTTTAHHPLSIDDRYETEKQSSKQRHWKESPFAVGLVTPSWEEEIDENSVCCINKSYCREEIDTVGCLCCSGWVCSKIGAGRVGNMAVLKQSMEWVEHVEVDEETGEETVTKFQRPALHCVVGPYWPMLICVTYPLIIGVSLLTLWKGLPGKHPLVILFWAICTVTLIYSLYKTSFSDPGILYRHESPPPQDENSWRWSDQAQSFRPRGAFYDTDCAVVVEEFDHTCPWTGTAIGKKNMPYFQMFVGLVFFCLVMDIMFLCRVF